MAIKVTFLKEDFTFEDDILVYLDMLNLTETIKNRLFDIFKKKVENSQSNCINSNELNDDIKEEASKYIKKLCEYDIYNKTIEEYAFENEGYKLYCKVNEDALNTMKKFLSEEIENFQNGLEQAELNAASNITGTGVKVWTNNFTTLAATSAYEYATIKKQINKADKQYKEELYKTSIQGNDKRAKQEKNYLEKIYFPEMLNAITVLSYCMLDKYLSDLSNKGIFNTEILKNVNIKKSQEILKNLSIAPNKEKVLISSFQLCPFNINIFYEVDNIHLLGNNEINTLKVMKQFDEFYNEIKKRFSEIKPSSNLDEDIKKTQPIIETLCLCNNTTNIYYYQLFTKDIYNKIIMDYDKIKKYSKNIDECEYLLDSFGEDILKTNKEQIYNFIKNKINEIVSENNFLFLINVCKYDNLMVKISSQELSYKNKADLDSYYIDLIYNNLIKLLKPKQEKVAKIIANEKLEKTKYNSKLTKRKIIITSIFLILIIIPILKQIISVSIWNNSVEQYVNKLIQSEMAEETANDENYRKMKIKSNYKIENITYYTDYFGFYIVPEVTFYSNVAKDSREDMLFWIDHMCYSTYDKEIKVPFCVLYGEKEHVNIQGNYNLIDKNGTIVQNNAFNKDSNCYKDSDVCKREKINPYLPTGFIVMFIFYFIILLCIYMRCHKLDFGLKNNNTNKVIK